MPGSVSDIGYFYRKSESVVTHLIEEYGAEKFRELLWEFGHGMSIDDALLETYGFDQDGLEREWGRASGYVPPDEPSSGRGEGVEVKTSDITAEEGRSQGDGQIVRERGLDELFLRMDSILLASVALLAAAVVGARYLYGRLSPRRRDRGNDEWGSGGSWEG